MLEHNDFTIGREFWTETGRWRCTDVGTRNISRHWTCPTNGLGCAFQLLILLVRPRLQFLAQQLWKGRRKYGLTY